MGKKLPLRSHFDHLFRTNRWFKALSRAQQHATTQLKVCPPGWQSRSVPLKVALLADLHMGSHPNDLARLMQIVDEVNTWKPDVILLLGDFVNLSTLGGSRVSVETIADTLRPLQSRLGIYAVLGNHDWKYGGLCVRRALETNEISVLENSSYQVADVTGDFWIAGLADDKTRSPQVAQTLSTVPEGAPTLIMAHDPAVFSEVPMGSHLTVCGHTHGGQICLPFVGPLINSSRAPLRWTSGYIVEDGRHLYVCRGLGTSMVPIRFNCSPELCLLSIGKS